ncbi:MAG: sulfotransferase [Leptolyngbyaceae cyanobacterium]
MQNQVTMSNPSSPLFATTPVVKESVPPVVVIGLPRSGSSYLAHVLSCMEGLYVFDDLYAYQHAKSLGLQGTLATEQQKAYLNKLGWSARGKVVSRKQDYAFAPQCTWEELHALEEAILKAFEGQSVTWPMLLEEWLTRLALHHQCDRWGYKTPQDFMHLDELTALFPGAKFVFVMRNPLKVMASFKNLPKPEVKGKIGDGSSSQYHPLVYANYWKLAYQRTTAFMKRRPEVPVYIVKFETLVAHPDNEAAELAEFLNTRVTQSVQVERPNTSFDAKKRRDVTDTEVWLCERIAGSVMQQAGYELKKQSPRFQDIPDLIGTSFNFASYQVQRLVSNKRARQSVQNYLNNFLGKKK